MKLIHQFKEGNETKKIVLKESDSIDELNKIALTFFKEHPDFSNCITHLYGGTNNYEDFQPVLSYKLLLEK